MLKFFAVCYGLLLTFGDTFDINSTFVRRKSLPAAGRLADKCLKISNARSSKDPKIKISFSGWPRQRQEQDPLKKKEFMLEINFRRFKSIAILDLVGSIDIDAANFIEMVAGKDALNHQARIKFVKVAPHVKNIFCLVCLDRVFDIYL